MLYPVQSGFRNRLDLSGIWDFQTDPGLAGRSAGWPLALPSPRPIAVPGSWNEQYEDLHGYLGLSWYLKRAWVPSSWKGQRIMLRVGSANYFGTVYVNGVEAGSHEGGHLPFAFDISPLVRWDEENVFAISVENELKPARVPSGNLAKSSMSLLAGHPATTFDFFPFAGIHRPVLLYSLPELSIDDVTVVTGFEGNAARGTSHGADGWVKVTVQLSAAAEATGTALLRSRDGSVAASGTLTFDASGKAEIQLSVPGAHPWSDRDPYLYDLELSTGGDAYSLKAGIRSIEVRGHEILLNGSPVKLNGYGRHEDFFASGKGLNLPLLVKDYHLMRWTGANSYRTSHYPYSEEEMQMADREGFLIIDEIPAVSLAFDTKEHMDERLRVCRNQLREMIARDKNHAAVVMWCVANEPMPANLSLAGSLGGGEEDPAALPGKAFLENLIDLAKSLDSTRPVTIVTVMGGPRSWMEKCDVICMNRYWGWYVLGGRLEQAFTALEHELDAVYSQWKQPIIMTEFGADTMAGMHGLPDLMWTEEYQASILRGHLEVAARKPYIAGMQVWNFADFAAVQSIGRVGGLNMKGVFTRSRAPKMAAHLLREFWAGKK
jgi:beta-glucuronidase